jgi:hypothetical protein
VIGIDISADIMNTCIGSGRKEMKEAGGLRSSIQKTYNIMITNKEGLTSFRIDWKEEIEEHTVQVQINKCLQYDTMPINEEHGNTHDTTVLATAISSAQVTNKSQIMPNSSNEPDIAWQTR